MLGSKAFFQAKDHIPDLKEKAADFKGSYLKIKNVWVTRFSIKLKTKQNPEPHLFDVTII